MDKDARAIVPKKKTKGRAKKKSVDQRIKEIQKEASELSKLSVHCGAEFAILIRSPEGKMSSFGSPSAAAVISRFEGETSSNLSQRQTAEQVSGKEEGGKPKWWEKSTEGMNLEELESFAQDLDAYAAQVSGKEEGGKPKWWEKSTEGMNLEELESFAQDLDAFAAQIDQS